MQRLALPDLVVCQQTSGHVPGECVVHAVLVFYPYAQTVRIRVCGQDKVCIHFLCQFQAQLKSLVRFRVRIADCGELTVRQLLFRDYIDILKAQLF